MIAIVCGMASEAAVINSPVGALVVQGRSNDATLRADLAAAIAAGGISGVMSVGLSGGLTPDLKVGDVVVARFARSAGDLLPSQPSWRHKLMSRLVNNVPLRFGDVCYSAEVVATAAAKAALLASCAPKTSACAVDEETWVAADVAWAHGLPFAALRVISDPYDFDMPPAALAALNEDGEVDVMSVIASLAANDEQMPALFTMGSYASTALTGLARAMLYAGVDFGFAS